MCCALPSLLVLLGLGATVASVLSAAPWLVALSHHKTWVFGVAGALLGENLVYRYLGTGRLAADRSACSVEGIDACGTTSRVGRSVNLSLVSSLCFAKMFPLIKRRLRRDWGRRLPGA